MPGNGQAIGPADQPGGSVHSSVVGNPESPGLRQYVCQPGSGLRRNAIQFVAPGSQPVCSATSSAST
jgi:hypothetical protein